MSSHHYQDGRPNFLRRQPGILESFLNVCHEATSVLNIFRKASNDAPVAPYKVPAPREFNHK